MYQGNPSTNTTTDITQTPTEAEFWWFFGLWLSGSGPASTNYGPNDGWTKALAGSITFNTVRQRYKSLGCPALTPPNDAAQLDSHHVPPFLDGYGGAINPNQATPNYPLMEVGGFNVNAVTDNGVTTFALHNVAGWSSFSGATTFGYSVNDNPRGSTGILHNITQTFTWTENNLCGNR